MTRATASNLIFCLYAAGLLFAATWASRRTHSAGDFMLGNRRAGIFLTACSYTATALPPWLLFAVGGAAFAWGLSAVWIAAAMLSGCCVNWLYIGARVRMLSSTEGHVTFLQVLSADAGDRQQPLVVRSGALILLAVALWLASGQLHTASEVLNADFSIGAGVGIGFGITAIASYIIAGGYWAATLSDAAQVAIFLLIGLFLPLPSILAAGDWQQLTAGFAALGPEARDWFGGRSSIAAIAFAAGVLALGLSLTGQPSAITRCMAGRDASVLRRAGLLSMLLAVMLLGAMLACGWCAKVLYAGLENPGFALFAMSNRMLPPWMAGAIGALLVCTMFSSTGSYLLLAASHLAADFRSRAASVSIDLARAAVAGVALAVACCVLLGQPRILQQGLFAFTAMGSAFGPLLLVRLAGKRVRPGSSVGAMAAGFILTLLFHLLPDAPGDFLERALPFAAALGIALTGGERRRNPDRADRGQETVHDKVPI